MMNASQKLKWSIIRQCFNEFDDTAITVENIDELWDQAHELDEFNDINSECREGDIETDIPAPSSRHLESKSVACKAPDGSWIGWTYWYGGGKHAEPAAVEWIGEAYNLYVDEQEKMVVVRTFSKY